ncbi:hypothetical protein ACFWCB_18800 [Streptomyces sp. NPDC060048]|uniref:hypothetical protein n=1 Tax=unclassified Streptomyces TaxID=2593676 RepID=UPI00368A3CFC
MERLNSLGLKRDDFLVFGSAPLMVYGLRRELGDLDILARGEAWERAHQLGDPSTGKATGSPSIQFWGGEIEVFDQWISQKWQFDRLVSRADVIEGVRFADLHDVLAYKAELMRPKDLADIHALRKLLIAELG